MYIQWDGLQTTVLVESLGRLSYCGPAEPYLTGRRAWIEATGDLSLAANEFALRAKNVLPNRVGVFLASRQPGFLPGFGGGDGKLCISAPIGHFRTQAAAASPMGVLAIDVALPTLSALGILLPGDSFHFQCWYRDVGGRSNTTEAVKVYFN